MLQKLCISHNCHVKPCDLNEDSHELVIPVFTATFTGCLIIGAFTCEPALFTLFINIIIITYLFILFYRTRQEQMTLPICRPVTAIGRNYKSLHPTRHHPCAAVNQLLRQLLTTSAQG